MGSSKHRRHPAAWLVSLCLPVAVLATVPGTAVAVGASGSTLRAVLDAKGTVTKVEQISADGSSSAFSGKLPVELSVQRSTADGRSQVRYHVENVVSQTQDVTYTDVAGKTHSSKVELQLPLVAQLGVTVPSTMKDVKAAGATVTTDADGTKHLLWQMVLFSPLGSPAQDVYVSSTGSGTPAAQVRAVAVDPTATPGLSAASQAANQAQTQEDFWHQYASGGNDGLTKLRDGMVKLVAGLELLAPGSKQLASGLGAAGDGATKLDAGTTKAKDGAIQLSAGLGKIHEGQVALTGGLDKLHTGQDALTSGLVQITGGLGQLADAEKGLPAAVTGLKQIQAGLTKLQAGVGDDATAGTLINGVDQVQAGITGIKTAIADPTKGIAAGVGCAAKVVGIVAKGSGALTGTVDPCFGGPIPPLPGVDPVSAAVLGKYAATLGAIYTGLTAQVIPGLTALEAGEGLIRAGLSHAATSTADPGGVKEGLALLAGGLAQVEAGIAKASDGTALLYAGSGKALDGSKQLATGSGQALTGSQQLTTGSGQAYDGSKALVSGLTQLSDGQHQVAAGLPAAVSGAVKIADGIAAVLTGATQVRDGIGQAQDQAVAPLEKQLAEGAQNARQQVAVLSAAGALASTAPGGADTSYVIAQDGSGFELAASSGSSGGSHTTRNVGIGVGGALLLVLGLAGGFMAGRKRGLAG